MVINWIGVWLSVMSVLITNGFYFIRQLYSYINVVCSDKWNIDQINWIGFWVSVLSVHITNGFNLFVNC